MPFAKTFGETLSMLRKVFQTTNSSSQPFIVAGSGTLGWDMVAANLVERGEEVLVLHTGYFADSFADCFETYGVKATQIKAPIGSRPQLPEIEQALKAKDYKIITVTHVDTSTGVLSDVKELSELIHRVSPKTLVVVDGVCSVGCEDIRFDEWGLDVVLTASQKALGCPAGLSILMTSGRAMETLKARKSPPSSYYASLKNWLSGTLFPLMLESDPLTTRTLIALSSNAKVRSSPTVLFRHSPAAIDPRVAHVSHSDHVRLSHIPLCRPPCRVSEGQGRRERAWAPPACHFARRPGECHDGFLPAGRRQGP